MLLNRWFKNDAKKFAKRLEMRVFTAHVEGTPRPVGFYALRIGSESTLEFDDRPDDYTKSRPSFPAFHLSYLGVDKEFQRRRIGFQMMSDVFDRVYTISQNAGMYALTLQALDVQAKNFYEKLGFEIYKDDPDNPKMLLPIRTVVQLVERV